MPVIPSAVNTRSAVFETNRKAMLDALALVEDAARLAMDGGGAKARFYLRGPALAAAVSPEVIYWQVVTPWSQYVSSSDASVTASGGTAPYSYAWQTNNGSASVNDDTAAMTGFQSTDGLPAEAWCIVTDAEGQSVETNRVSLL